MTRYPNKCEYEQRTKRRNDKRGRGKNSFFSAEPKDTTSTKHDTTVPSAKYLRCSDATMSTPAPSNGATGTAAKSLKIKNNTKEVPKKNRRPKKLKNTFKSCKFYY